MLQHPDTDTIILCPQCAVKAFKRELTEKVKVSFNLLTSAKPIIQPGARIHVITHSALKKYLNFIDELHNAGRKLILMIDEAQCCDYDTLISTDIGELKIGDIVTKNIKCKVFSYNKEKDTIECKPIIEYFENNLQEDLYEISYIENNIIRTVKVTGSHPIYTKNRGYVEACKLNKDDIILSLRNTCKQCGKLLVYSNTGRYNHPKNFCNKSCATKYSWNNKTGIYNGQFSNKGKKRTEEFREKQSKYMKKNNPMYNKEHRNKMVNTIRKMALEGKLKNNFKYGNGKMSKAEEFIYKDLIKLDFEYNKGVSTKKYKKLFPHAEIPFSYKADYINKELKIAIEIDGNSHRYDRVKIADKKKQDVFNFYGYIVLRFSNEEILNNKDRVLKEIVECMKKVK